MNSRTHPPLRPVTLLPTPRRSPEPPVPGARRRGSERRGLPAPLADSNLAQQYADLERSNAALRRFAALVAHDLRAPARQMSGFCRLLGQSLGGRLQPHEAEMLRQIEHGAGEMQDLVAELLEASRPDTPGDYRSLDLKELGDAFAAEFSDELEEQGSRLRWHATGRVAVHAPTVRRVLHHLIDNALRHAGAGATITVLYELRGSGPEFLVRDDGNGIETEAFCSLFHGAREASADGGGMGLGLCRQLLEARRGWIRAEPHAHGSSFRFALPAVPARRVAPA